MRATIAALSFVFTMVYAGNSTSDGGRTAYSGAYYLHELKASILVVLEQNQPQINEGRLGPKSSKLLPVAVFARSYDLFTEVVGDDFSIAGLGRDADRVASALAIMLHSGRVTIARLQREIDTEPDGSVVAARYRPDDFGRDVAREFQRRTGVVFEQTPADDDVEVAADHDAPLDAWRVEDPAFIRVSIPQGR